MGLGKDLHRGRGRKKPTCDMMFYVGKEESAVVLPKLYQLYRAMPRAYVNIFGEGVCEILVSLFLRLCVAFFHSFYLPSW